jgi:hypothetical protein
MPEAAAIPIIDISAEDADELEVAKALVDAAAEYGFVYIKNTGKDISVKQVQDAFNIVSVQPKSWGFVDLLSSLPIFLPAPLEADAMC